MSKTVTHKDLARKLKVSETTIKSYRRKFPDCIPVANQGKPIRFSLEAEAVCCRIRDLFDLGMSIEEVRMRLAQDFSWIPEPQKTDQTENSNKNTAVSVSQDYTIALSNLAKSMVTLVRQQNTLMDRMDRMEKLLMEKDFSSSSLPDGEGNSNSSRSLIEDLQAYLHNALVPLEELQRLSEIQNVTEVLRHAAGSMVDVAQILRSLDKSKLMEAPEASSKVVQFPTQAVSAQQADGPQVPQDPPRAFLLKPLMIRTAEGAYTSAGGKARGRFTLNDLKALLIYGSRNGKRYTLQWELLGQDWNAHVQLTGNESEEQSWGLRIKEAVTKNGADVVEINAFYSGEDQLHPAEFCVFVDALVEE